MTVSVRIRNLSKEFKVRLESDRSFFGSIKNVFSNKKAYKKFYSLKNISFDVNKGDVVGVIGPNGSGKTTLLRLIAKLFSPTKGKIISKGKILPIIDIGADINPNLTGKENFFLSGTILGFKKKYIKSRYSDLVSFSGLEKFMNVKTKFYSNGMKLRLAFSVFLLMNPDIVLFDEVFSVGDSTFQKKCLKKFNEYRKHNKTIIIASHDLGLIKTFCNKCLLLDDGYMKSFGVPELVIKDYLSLLNKRVFNKDEIKATKDVELTSFRIINSLSVEKNSFKQGEKIIFEFAYKVNKSLQGLQFGIGVFSSDGFWITGPNNSFLKKNYFNHSKQGLVKFTIPSNPFMPGTYFITVSVSDSEGKILFDKKDLAYSFEIVNSSSTESFGVVSIPHKWSVE